MLSINNSNVAFGANVSQSLRRSITRTDFGKSEAQKIHKQLNLIVEKGADNVILYAKELKGKKAIFARLKGVPNVSLKLRQLSSKDFALPAFLEKLNLGLLQSDLTEAVLKKYVPRH